MTPLWRFEHAHFPRMHLEKRDLESEGALVIHEQADVAASLGRLFVNGALAGGGSERFLGVDRAPKLFANLTLRELNLAGAHVLAPDHTCILIVVFTHRLIRDLDALRHIAIYQVLDDYRLDLLAQLGLGNRDGRRQFGGRGRGIYRVRRGDARADLLHWRL